MPAAVMRTPRRSNRALRLTAMLAAALWLSVPAATQSPRFLPDDPLQREPDSQDASRAKPWDIDLSYELARAYTVVAQRTPSGRRAANVNSIDEVPDSSWFTNRIGSRRLSAEDIITGPNEGPPPDEGAWTVLREKTSGFAAGFTAKDARGSTWFVSFDAPANPEGATGAIVVATKLFWALGYHQVENHLATVDPARLTTDPSATVRRASGRRTRMTSEDIADVLSRARPGPDGTYRVAAGRGLSGTILGGFRYEGTRPDDPNDVVDHEHRRELRALRVFGAWANLTDMKAGNTLDTVRRENGRGVVRHYLQDVGSTFGVGAGGPHDWNEGWEYVVQVGPALRRLFTLGLALSRWQTMPVEELPAVGRFEGDAFDPTTWRPRAPTAAYIEMRDDDAFWAARRVMAFSDDAIRAAVSTGRFSDPRAARLLETVLIKRRDAIGRAYLPKLNPIVEPALTADALTLHNAAVDHRVATEPRQYHARWSAFDNATGTSRPLGETASATATLPLPAGGLDAAGPFVRVELWADHAEHASWATPIETVFRREGTAWRLVGLVRQK